MPAAACKKKKKRRRGRKKDGDRQRNSVAQGSEDYFTDEIQAERGNESVKSAAVVMFLESKWLWWKAADSC